MKKLLAIGMVTLLVSTVLSGIALAQIAPIEEGPTGALAITTDPSNVLVRVRKVAPIFWGGELIVENYSPFWTGGLAPIAYEVTAYFTNPEHSVVKVVTVIADQTVPVHFSAKTQIGLELTGTLYLCQKESVLVPGVIVVEPPAEYCVDLAATIINAKTDKLLPASNKVVKFYRSSGEEIGSVETVRGQAELIGAALGGQEVMTADIVVEKAYEFYAVLYFADRVIKSNDLVLVPPSGGDKVTADK